MTKKALVVGIDKYRNPEWNLQGCTMDAAVMSGVLQDHYGFPRENIRMVLDDRATKSNLLERLDWLVRGAQPGDILVFFYAGHGSQVRDRDGDELDDQMDEILCPHDLNWDDPLTDDILHNCFKQLPQGANLTVVFDCCNSGTGTRSLWAPVAPDGKVGAVEYRKVRYIKPPLDIEYRSRGIKLETRRIGEAVMQENHVLLTAAASYQEAQETRIDGQVRGAFTYFFVETLKRLNWTSTYRQAHDDTLIRMRDKGFVQIPQLEGPAERLEKPIFS
jgi:hypothetical protein